MTVRDPVVPASALLRQDRSAYAKCGPQGSLQTVKALTGLEVNYLITVNFRGFVQIVDKLGGAWIDVDRRYFNDRGGPSGYATINLRAGLSAADRPSDARLRPLPAHRLRSLPGGAPAAVREGVQEPDSGELRADRAAQGREHDHEATSRSRRAAEGRSGGHGALVRSASPTDCRVAGCSRRRIEGFEGVFELTTDSSNVTRAIQTFTHPDVQSSEKATAVALGREARSGRAPAPRDTTITVLNGNGVAGSASTAGFLLGERGYQILTPPNGLPANAPSFDYFRTTGLLRRPGAGREQPPKGRRTCSPRPRRSACRRSSPSSRRRRCSPSSSGQTFHESLAAAPIDQTPRRESRTWCRAPAPPATSCASGEGSRSLPAHGSDGDRAQLLDGPTEPVRAVLDRSGREAQGGAARLPHGLERVLGREMTDWEDAPVLAISSLHAADQRTHLRPLLQRPEAAHGRPDRRRHGYWVVNSLLDRLSNETMLAIAKGLKPLGKARGSRMRVAVFGAGYVGLVTGACLADLGHEVVVRDIVLKKIDDAPARRGAHPRGGARRADRTNTERLTLHHRSRGCTRGR